MLHGILVMPSSGQATAGVVLVHGSGPDGADDYLSQAEAFARGGVAALVYDKRGWNRSGGDWKKRSFDLLASDAMSAARALRSHPGVPSDRVGYWGVSQGGWVVAVSAARDGDTAFVIGVAATGVSPTSQELWHKEQMMNALGYSAKARSVALDFWRLAFDFLVKVDEGTIPLPANVLVNERAGASTGLNFDPLPSWSRIRAPVLLLYGEKDLLEPALASAQMIPAALNPATPRAAIIFPTASHTITTRQTGLVFDWGDAFHFAYYPTMLRWIINASIPPGAPPSVQLSPETGPSPFNKGERYGEATILRSSLVQLPLLLGLPLLLLWSGTYTTLGIWRKGVTSARLLDFSVAVGGLIIFTGFVLFIRQSVFAQGLTPMDRYVIPGWQRALPIGGSVVALFALLAAAMRSRQVQAEVVGLAAAVTYILWAVTWGMVGLPL